MLRRASYGFTATRSSALGTSAATGSGSIGTGVPPIVGPGHDKGWDGREAISDPARPAIDPAKEAAGPGEGREYGWDRRDATTDVLWDADHRDAEKETGSSVGEMWDPDRRDAQGKAPAQPESDSLTGGVVEAAKDAVAKAGDMLLHAKEAVVGTAAEGWEATKQTVATLTGDAAMKEKATQAKAAKAGEQWEGAKAYPGAGTTGEALEAAQRSVDVKNP